MKTKEAYVAWKLSKPSTNSAPSSSKSTEIKSSSSGAAKKTMLLRVRRENLSNRTDLPDPFWDDDPQQP